MSDILHIDLPQDIVIRNDVTPLVGWYSTAARTELVELTLGEKKVDYAKLDRPDVLAAVRDRPSVGFRLVVDLSKHWENLSGEWLNLSLVVDGQPVAVRQIRVLEKARRRASCVDAVRAQKRRWLLVHLCCLKCGSKDLHQKQHCFACAECSAAYEQTGGALNMLTEQEAHHCKIVSTDNVEILSNVVDGRGQAAFS